MTAVYVHGIFSVHHTATLPLIFISGWLYVILWDVEDAEQTSKTIQINFVENHNVLQFLANVQNISPEDKLKIVITRQAKQDRRNTQLYVPLLATLLMHILG